MVAIYKKLPMRTKQGVEWYMLSQLSAAKSDRGLHKKREYPRALVNWPVTVISSNATYEGRAINISQSGTLILLAYQLDLGEHVRLEIEIPKCKDPIIAKADILREFPLRSGAEHSFSYCIALAFTEISKENLKLFSENLASELKKYPNEIDLSSQAALTKKVKIIKSNNEHKHYALWAFCFMSLITTIYLLFISL